MTEKQCLILAEHAYCAYIAYFISIGQAHSSNPTFNTISQRSQDAWKEATKAVLYYSRLLEPEDNP
jgi:hypothetical protein